jgi:diketogulonate reductase-like aldo/keto reductase
MKIPTKKLKNGFEMPVYGLGTWKMGEDSSQKQAEVAAIREAIEEGITHIDTAEVYANGGAEEIIGEAIKHYDRKNLFLVSKVFGDHLRYDKLLESAKKSIERLKTDYLDLYLLHRFNPEVPLEETMKAMNKLREQGLIKNIGISNFTVTETIEAKKNSKNPVVANQLHLNLKFRESERKGLLKYCQEEDMIFIAWSPLKGFSFEEKILLNMAKKYEKTARQIALNWLISQKNVVTLSKTTTIEHLKENLGAVGFIMEDADIEKLRNEFPGQEDISDTVPLFND